MLGHRNFCRNLRLNIRTLSVNRAHGEYVFTPISRRCCVVNVKTLYEIQSTIQIPIIFLTHPPHQFHWAGYWLQPNQITSRLTNQTNYSSLVTVNKTVLQCSTLLKLIRPIQPFQLQMSNSEPPHNTWPLNLSTKMGTVLADGTDMILSSLCLSVTLYIVAKQYILQQKCLNKRIGRAPLGTWFYRAVVQKSSPVTSHFIGRCQILKPCPSLEVTP